MFLHVLQCSGTDVCVAILQAGSGELADYSLFSNSLLGCEQGEGKAVSSSHVTLQHLCEIDVVVTALILFPIFCDCS